jgi:hypothetical protein
VRLLSLDVVLNSKVWTTHHEDESPLQEQFENIWMRALVSFIVVQAFGLAEERTSLETAVVALCLDDQKSAHVPLGKFALV